MDVRWRVSLFGRAIVSLTVLGVFGVLLTGVFVAMAVLSVLVAVPYVYPVVVGLTWLPHLTAVLPLPAVLVCTVSWLTLYGLFRYGGIIERLLGIEYLWWPETPRSAVTTGLSLGLLYEGVVEVAVVITAGARNAPLELALVVGGLATIIGVRTYVKAIKTRMTSLREVSTTHREPAPQWLRQRVARLCQVADVAVPAVSLLPSSRSLAFTVGGKTERAIVLSQGIVDTLSDEELDAVLAHEVSHVANRDVTVMSAALAPVLVCQEMHDGDATDLVERAVQRAISALRTLGEFGAGVFSRKRELAADRGAARITGQPAALASALETLETECAAPETDFRESEEAVSVLNVVPYATDQPRSFATHPETATRIARLRALEKAQERSH